MLIRHALALGTVLALAGCTVEPPPVVITPSPSPTPSCQPPRAGWTFVQQGGLDGRVVGTLGGQPWAGDTTEAQLAADRAELGGPAFVAEFVCPA